MRDAARAGIAKTIMMEAISVIHTKSGTRRMVMPGARSVKTVTIRLIADPIEPAVIISSARAQ